MALCFALMALFLLALMAKDAGAQDIAPVGEGDSSLAYMVQLSPVESPDLASALAASSLLLTQQELPLEQRADLLRRGRRDQERLEKVLRSHGYYDGTVAITIAGEPISAPEIRTVLADAPPPLDVIIGIEPGALYRLNSISLDWRDGVPADLTDPMAVLGLSEGDPALGADIYRARARLIEVMHARGYPLVEAEEPDAVIDRATQMMDVRYPVTAGGKATLGPVTYTGNDGVETELLERVQPFEPGEPYSPSELAALRSELSALGVFSAVRVREGEALDAQGRLPITVELSERKRRFIGFGAKFASDEGIGLNAEWGHRNLFGQAEQLTATASVNRIAGDVGTGVDYSVGLGFSKPAFYRGDQRLFSNGAVLKESPDAYDRKAITSELGVERRLNPILSASLAGSLEISEITEEGNRSEYFLVGLPATLKLDSTNDLLDPTSGWRGSVEATPFVDLGLESEPFFRFGGSLARYFDVLGNGRSIIAGRVGFGATLGEATRALPADKRFFSGGGGSVRGYEFQTLGPLNQSGDPKGGRSLLEAGLELRQRVGENWGGVAFIDSGSAFTTTLPLGAGDLRYAVGVGLRYFTPIGPIRADIAVPIDRKGGEAGFQFYIGLGQAF